MFAGRVKKVVALGSATVALAAGAVLGAVGTASAATPHHGPGDHRAHCRIEPGHWVRTWHPATRDHRRKLHSGFWTRTWVPAHKVCER
ncbi:hypothetical protein [Streptacidiphilus melanogenes]|uniref:hypothetical protein n=1 Tax=Streptacidiphilus melanogenes TaxID=411235 RepID=UPI0005AA1E94|nr:hypothetical protein [Streptacidiphilus melanogenes]